MIYINSFATKQAREGFMSAEANDNHYPQLAYAADGGASGAGSPGNAKILCRTAKKASV